MTVRDRFHLIVAQMMPSAEQEPAIMERGRDVVVMAGAGSGKTRTLVARYLALLAEGCPLRGAIAITFTEKAAREMRNRVREQIRRYLEKPGLPEAERERWQGLYGGLDAARIGTIHGLCSEILRSHPAEAAVDPRFTVLDEGQANLLQRQAVAETLGWAAEDSNLAPLFGLLGERGLRETLAALLRRRLDAAETFSRMPDDVLASWQAVLVERQAQTLAGLMAHFDWQDAAAVVRSNQAAVPDDLLEIQRRTALAALRDAQGRDTPDRLAALVPLGEIRLSGGRVGAWSGGKEQIEEVKAALKVLRRLWSGSEVLHLYLTPLDKVLADALPDLRACFDFMCDRYAALKSEREALDFDDLEAGALALLEGNAAVRARWSDEAAALLVDEFQDTNDRQRRLARCLNTGSNVETLNDPAPVMRDRGSNVQTLTTDGGAGKLFIVGDAKQSIYRFRGADVTVFREERERIARAGGAVLSLDTSYRAHRELLEGLNDLLRPVLGEDADPSRPWAEPFARLRPYRQTAGSGFVAPHIEIHLALGPKSEGGLDRAADALAERLASLVEAQGIFVEGDKELRRLDYGDVAILCRASTSFSAYEDALERAGIPFLTVAGRGFYGRPEIRDLLNGLSALADPTDDLALAGLLRSPALALSDAALYGLAAARRGEAFERLNDGTLERPAPVARDRGSGVGTAPHLWDVLRELGAELPGEDGGRAARAAGLIAELHAQAGRAPVADLLKAFLDRTGYRAALIAAGQTRAARNVAKLLADAHASGLVGVGEFLEYVGELRDSGTREGEARSTAEGAVQIMSVHAAKGMEYPVVVLGDITYRPPSRNGILFDADLGALLPQRDDEKNTAAVYQLARWVADDQEAAESDRLLYVAATRAREKLILSGCTTTRQDGAIGVSGGWLKRMDEAGSLPLAGRDAAVGEEATEGGRLDLRIGGAPVGCTIYGPGWAAERVRREAPTPPPEPDVPLPPPLLSPVLPESACVDDRTTEQERDPGQRVWRVVPPETRLDAPRWVVGTLVHEALAAWRFPGVDGSFDRWVEAQARGYGLTDPRPLANAVAKCRGLLLRLREHPLYEEMAGAEPRRHEVPYSRINEDGQVESGVIDVLYLRGGAWTIVEFKTDRVADIDALEELIEREGYRSQVERYRKAVEWLAGGRPQVILCFLDCATAVHLHRLQG
jgi:ATP-dependent helicase/nuclease subunit A